MTVDFDAHAGTFVATITEDVSVDFQKLVSTSTCLQFAPTSLIDGVLTEPDTMRVRYSSSAGLTVTGPATVVDKMKTITSTPDDASGIK